MKGFTEKRNEMRLNVNCDIYCQVEGFDDLYEAQCVSLSGSGISFFTEHEFKVGDNVDVIIKPETKEMEEMQFFIKIVRTSQQDDNTYVVGASIYYKGDFQQ